MECEKLAFLLSKCHFEQIPGTDDSVQDVEDRIRWMFDGNERSARMALENYANDQGKCNFLYGEKWICAARLWEECGYL